MRLWGRVLVFATVIWCTVLASCLILYAHKSNDSYRGTGERTRRATEQNEVAEKTDIFFLKTHKCASSTIQNILMRFGYRRHLDFVLPLKDNYLGHPAQFNRNMIPRELTSFNQTYNIFTHHSRYNYEEVKAVMNENATFVTMLRNPASLFESMYQYYRLEVTTNMTLQKFIKNPDKWFYLAVRSPARKIGTNQMSFDLGLNVAEFVDGKRNDSVDDFIRKIETEFDLVMITEYMEASLVLLSKLMNWPLEHVASFKVNSRQLVRKVQLTLSERDSLMYMNFIDARVYKHFLKKFQSRIADFGVELMKEEVRKLLDLNSKLWSSCVDKPNFKGYGRTLSYDLRNPQDFGCFYSAKDELSFTEEIRNDQVKRFSTLRKLDSLMDDYVDER
ncbi:hypothetical protein GE061_006906 [Apolygus lucorum]|uniref:Sulfotransferase domain-containing protein n=1 Tax=Apolygus lucorum TaxID=248454 RepID=A0A8S9WQF9_APOLU|nr:hypothetical protein GE061_006906 [Apolygus lucorum]